MTKTTTGPGEDGLARRLQDRHIQLIALGGAIGVGLFLGSATAIQKAGPSVLLAYIVAGLVVFIVMRALGELLMYRPVTGSFASYAGEFVGPWAGFFTGWSYWLMWITVGIAEISAIGIYLQHWIPAIPQWLPGLVALAVLLLINLRDVRMFGEFEFWFALIKVLTIVALILVGVAILVFGIGPLGATGSVSNLWSHGGFFPNGGMGWLLAFPIALYAFGGTEVIGVTAGEAENPSYTLPRAINRVLYRILLFYVGALAVILALIPWNELSSRGSPFTLLFQQVGIPGASDFVQFVVLTAAASAFSTGIFTAGRMLLSLADAGQAPSALRGLNGARVPAPALIVSAGAMAIGVLLNYTMPDDVFVAFISIGVVIQIWSWGMIVLAHMGFRRAVKAGRLPPASYRMPGAPWANWAVLLVMLGIGVSLAFDPATRIALYVAPIWFGALALAWFLVPGVRAAASAPHG